MDKTRPDPQALLELANKIDTKRGRLKIFLGAAPGVGKTYAMLSAAKKLHAEGCHIAIGLVETHGRKETESLLEGLPILPRQTVEYKERSFVELNLPLILKNKPDIVIVDELAHTNIPGSKHQKRYLDIEELLDSGIHVYTTLNVQHIESLNDDIEQVTGVKVRETVPDSLLESADEIVVIDLTPSELIQRLREGKVYVPDMAQRAIQHFFSMNNIAALRELTFRAAAKYAGQDLTNYKQVNQIETPWHVNESIAVCLSSHTITPKLIRIANKLAKKNDAKLIAIYVETPSSSKKKAKELLKINRYKLYAQQQGAEVVTLAGVNKAKSIIQYAKSHNITEIVIGKTIRAAWLDRMFGSIVYEIIRNSDGITVHVINNHRSQTGDEEDESMTKEKMAWRPFLYSLLAVVFAGWISHWFKSDLSLATDTMLFLLAVVFSAFRFGLYPSLFASTSSFLIYLYFCLPPIRHFHFETLSQLVTFIAFIIVSITISQLAGRAKASIENANQREQTTSLLYSFSQMLAAIDNQDSLLNTTIKTLTNYFKTPVTIILPGENPKRLQQNYPIEIHLHKKDWAAAKWSFEHQKPCGKGTETLSGADWYYHPLYATEKTIGIVAVKVKEEERFFHPDSQYVFLSVTNQLALALAKLKLETMKTEPNK